MTELIDKRETIRRMEEKMRLPWAVLKSCNPLLEILEQMPVIEKEEPSPGGSK